MRGRLVHLAVALCGACALVLVPALASSAQAASTDATVYAVHGIPNTPVDVYVDNKLTLPDFKPGTVSPPLTVPPGTYQVAVRKAGAAAGSSPVISANATLTAGENASLVAYLNSSGTPTLGAFVNDTSALPAGEGRVIVRHTADAPAVDILAGGKAVVSDLAPGQQAALVVPAGTVSAAVAVHGSTTPVLGPANVTVMAGTDTIVYAIGSASGKTLGLVVQTISGLGAMPGSVPTGNSPIGNHSALPLGALVAVLAGGLLLAGLSLGTLRRARWVR